MTDFLEGACCKIWGSQVLSFEDLFANQDREITGYRVDSPRAGGTYEIDVQAAAKLSSVPDRVKAHLTTWLVDERQTGVLCPHITVETIVRAEHSPSLSVLERADRFLNFTAQTTSYIGEVITFLTENRFERGLGDITDRNTQRVRFVRLLAWCESTKESEFYFLKRYLSGRHWITSFQNDAAVQVTVDGYAHLDELKKTRRDSSQGFVAMWFGDDVRAAYEQGIHPAIKDAGYRPFRIDGSEHINRIDDEIVAQIRRSRFLVADFTHGETGPRGGVYYEAGFAHGLNLPVFWTCRENILKDIHFDIRQYNFIVWNTPEELRKRLATRISAVIGDGPHKGNHQAGMDARATLA